MNCEQVRPRLGELLDGELAADLRPPVDRHLEECPGCRSEYEALQSMATALAQPPKTQLPAGLWEAIEEQLEEAAETAALPGERAPRGHLLYRLGRRRLATAALVTLAVGLGWLAWNAPWTPTGMAAEIDFRPLLERGDGDIEAGINALLRTYGGEAISLVDAAKRMRVRVHAPATLAGDLRLKSTHLLKMGRHHVALAFHFQGPAGQLLLLQCPPNTKKDYGNHECLPCQVGSHAAHGVRVGKLWLMHMDSANVCICVVSTLDETSELPKVLDALRIEY